MTVIYSKDLFTYNAKYFQTLFREKWQFFANSLPSMLKLRSTVNEVAWQFNNFPYSSVLMFGQVISNVQLLLGYYSVRIGEPNTILFQPDRCQTQVCNLFHRLEQQCTLCSLLFVFYQQVKYNIDEFLLGF